MKKSEIKVGGYYQAKVSNKLTTVCVTAIDHVRKTKYTAGGTRYTCTNMATGREVTFKSAMKFRKEVAKPTLKASRKVVLSQDGYETTVTREEPKHKPTLADKMRPDMDEKFVSHAVVKALAGTGKTFTSIVGVLQALAPSLWDNFIQAMRDITNNPEFDIVPSDEQAAIWQFMEQFNGKVTTVVYCAFNKSIVTDFAEKWGFMVDMLAEVGIYLKFSTVNSLGNQACSRAFGRLNVTDDHTMNLVTKLTGLSQWDLRGSENSQWFGAVKQLVGLCKLNLTGWQEGQPYDPYGFPGEDLDELVAHYDIDMNGYATKVYYETRRVLAECLKPQQYREMDFNDQNWLPVVLNLPIPKCDWMMVDEGQDLPRCKQEFCRRACHNLMVTGDCNQAIYGFAGADVDSIPRMQQLLGEPTVLHLTETRRCGKAIVRDANEALVTAFQLRGEEPVEFKAHETNCAGETRSLPKAKYLKEVADGDMVLSRTTAPLISHALKLIRDGKKAVVRGRNFGGDLIGFINRTAKKTNAQDLPSLLDAVEEWFEKETEKELQRKNPSEARLIALEDRRDCIVALSIDMDSIPDVIAKIEQIFSGKVCPLCGRQYDENVERCFNRDCKVERDPITGYPCGPRLVTPPGVLYSTVHRAKGLEADSVYLLECDGSMLPHPMASTQWQRNQEWNLRYVAITRAIRRLTYVKDGK